MGVEVFGCPFVWTYFPDCGTEWRRTSHVRYTESRSMDRLRIEKVSKALGDQTRLKIFEAISAGKCISCGEIVSMRGVTPATVSHHLKILSEAGLIACRREGQFVYSAAIPETLADYTQALLKVGRNKKTARRQR